MGFDYIVNINEFEANILEKIISLTKEGILGSETLPHTMLIVDECINALTNIGKCAD